MQKNFQEWLRTRAGRAEAVVALPKPPRLIQTDEASLLIFCHLLGVSNGTASDL
jgi:hypothetical protein